MNKLLVLLALFSTQCLASDPAKDCERIEEFAREIMTMRQGGEPLRVLISKAETPLVKEVIVEAYREPRMYSKVNKQRMIDDYANKIYLQCYTVLSAELKGK